MIRNAHAKPAKKAAKPLVAAIAKISATQKKKRSLSAPLFNPRF